MEGGAGVKAYYQDDYCTIYHGDCREILPTLDKVDLVLTDPPYGIGDAQGKTPPMQICKFNTPTQLAHDHWAYTKGIIEACGITGLALRLAEYLYVQAFVHGFKHAKEDA